MFGEEPTFLIFVVAQLARVKGWVGKNIQRRYFTLSSKLKLGGLGINQKISQRGTSTL